MNEDSQKTEKRIQRLGNESLEQFCARLSEDVFTEKLSTWSMLKAAQALFPDLSERDVSLSVQLALESRRKELSWTT
jgi:hypothetical protein